MKSRKYLVPVGESKKRATAERSIRAGRKLAASHLHNAANLILEGRYEKAESEVVALTALLDVLIKLEAEDQRRTA